MSYQNRIDFAPTLKAGCRPFAVTEESIIFRGDGGDVTIPFENIKSFTIIQSPAKGFLINTDGIARLDTNDGKYYMCGYNFKERESFNQAFQRVKKAIAADPGCRYFLNAHTGSYIKVFDDYVIINHMRTGGSWSNILAGSSTGDKKIHIADISSVTLKEPAGVTVGFIQLSYAGSLEGKQNVVEAIGDENSVPVSPQNLELARKIVNFIDERRMALRKTTVTVQQELSSADEILKYKGLLDAGIISQAEFDAKKKQLLGL